LAPSIKKNLRTPLCPLTRFEDELHQLHKAEEHAVKVAEIYSDYVIRE